MNIKDLKKNVVEENKYCDSKEFNKIVRRLLLGLAFFSLAFIIGVDAILGMAFAIITSAICFVLAISVFSGMAESEQVFRTTQKVSKLWFLAIILLVLTVVILALLNFL